MFKHYFYFRKIYLMLIRFIFSCFTFSDSLMILNDTEINRQARKKPTGVYNVCSHIQRRTQFYMLPEKIKYNLPFLFWKSLFVDIFTCTLPSSVIWSFKDVSSEVAPNWKLKSDSLTFRSYSSRYSSSLTEEYCITPTHTLTNNNSSSAWQNPLKKVVKKCGKKFEKQNYYLNLSKYINFIYYVKIFFKLF